MSSSSSSSPAGAAIGASRVKRLPSGRFADAGSSASTSAAADQFRCGLRVSASASRPCDASSYGVGAAVPGETSELFERSPDTLENRPPTMCGTSSSPRPDITSMIAA